MITVTSLVGQRAGILCLLRVEVDKKNRHRVPREQKKMRYKDICLAAVQMIPAEVLEPGMINGLHVCLEC